MTTTLNSIGFSKHESKNNMIICKHFSFFTGFFVTLFILIVACENAQAVTIETADKALAQFKKLTRPNKTTNPFERWTYDTARFTTHLCWHAANPSAPVPKSLIADAYLMSTASDIEEVPRDNQLEPLCQSIASEGINPVCTSSIVWVLSNKKLEQWPIDYIVVSGDYSKMKVEGTLGCYLNSKQVQQQNYTANLTTKWKEKPHEQSIQKWKESKIVNMGTVQIIDAYAKGLDGKPYSEPKIVIVQE